MKKLSNFSCSEGFMMDSQTETETESAEEEAKAQSNKRQDCLNAKLKRSFTVVH